MIMSSLTQTEDRSFFIVQSGVVGWEDPQPIADWRRKTVSIVSRELATVMSMLWPIIATRPPRFGLVLRVSVTSIQNPMNELQKRRLNGQLMTVPPGFCDPIVEIGNVRACVLSELGDFLTVDPNFLTAYKNCILVELDGRTRSKSTLASTVCLSIRDFGNFGITTLLGSTDDMTVLRILDLESHSVVQIIGPPESSDAAVGCLNEKGVRRIHDVQDLSQEIAKFRI